MIRGATFQNFLLNAQSEVQRSPEEDVQVEVYLPTGKSLHVDVVSTNQTDDVLETVRIQLPHPLPHFVVIFGVPSICTIPWQLTGRCALSWGSRPT